MGARTPVRIVPLPLNFDCPARQVLQREPRWRFLANANLPRRSDPASNLGQRRALSR
jgi:hypothetical protein